MRTQVKTLAEIRDLFQEIILAEPTSLQKECLATIYRNIIFAV